MENNSKSKEMLGKFFKGSVILLSCTTIFTYIVLSIYNLNTKNDDQEISDSQHQIWSASGLLFIFACLCLTITCTCSSNKDNNDTKKRITAEQTNNQDTKNQVIEEVVLEDNSSQAITPC